MRRFNQFTFKKSILLFTFGIIFLYAFPANITIHAQQSPPIIGIKITSPTTGQQVPIGQLTISGISTDNPTTDCTVYADWNDTQPMQRATPAGLNFTEFGRQNNDYSTWTFTYTSKYHLINEGVNELTAKLSCDIGPFNVTKYDSVNVTGIPTED